MSLPLKEAQAATELAQLLYSFLPGSPHPYADKALSFPGVATQIGLGAFWPSGSKQPAIARLLTMTLEHERGRFCPLITAVIQNGIAYRQRKEPVTRGEIDAINTAIRTIGFKIPELHDPGFLSQLPGSSIKSARKSGEVPSQQVLSDLQVQFTEIAGLAPVLRGFAFERLLNETFSSWQLAPRGSFRLLGEQIDGSFNLDNNIYLVEARWRDERASIGDLLAFAGKVQGKASWSRGLFLSYSGFSEDALQALERGRRTEMIGMEGLDLHYVLARQIDLTELIRRRVRRAAETNRFFVPARELFSGII